MAITKTDKAKAVTGLTGGKVAFAATGGTWGEPQNFDYLTSLTLKNQVSDTDIYADDIRTSRKPADIGIEGEIGTTAPDVAFEKEAGYLSEADKGALAEVKQRGYKACCFYFEHGRIDKTTGAEYKVKTWVLNGTIGKPAEESHETNKDKPSLGAYKYPISVDGVNMKDAAGTADAIDENGYPICVYKLTSCPGDAGYATFGDTVPVVKMKTV